MIFSTKAVQQCRSSYVDIERRSGPSRRVPLMRVVRTSPSPGDTKCIKNPNIRLNLHSSTDLSHYYGGRDKIAGYTV